jgi:hypothetical protein
MKAASLSALLEIDGIESYVVGLLLLTGGPFPNCLFSKRPFSANLGNCWILRWRRASPPPTGGAFRGVVLAKTRFSMRMASKTGFISTKCVIAVVDQVSSERWAVEIN